MFETIPSTKLLGRISVLLLRWGGLNRQRSDTLIRLKERFILHLPIERVPEGNTDNNGRGNGGRRSWFGTLLSLEKKNREGGSKGQAAEPGAKIASRSEENTH